MAEGSAPPSKTFRWDTPIDEDGDDRLSQILVGHEELPQPGEREHEGLDVVEDNRALGRLRRASQGRVADGLAGPAVAQGEDALAVRPLELRPPGAD